MPVKGSYLAIAAGGGILLWSGLKGKNWSDVLRQLIAGKKPGTTTTAYEITSPGGSTILNQIPTGKVLSPVQIRMLWIAAGGNPAKSGVATCIATHESGGRVTVTSSNPDGGTNVGIWQLDTRGKGAGFTVAQLQNAFTNARVTVRASSNGTDWSAWATAGDCGV